MGKEIQNLQFTNDVKVNDLLAIKRVGSIEANCTSIEIILNLIAAYVTSGSFAPKGLAVSTTNPGTPTQPDLWYATPGVTYTNFKDNAGTAITIPTMVSGNYVADARLIWTGTYWVAVWSTFAPPSLTGYATEVFVNNKLIYSNSPYVNGVTSPATGANSVTNITRMDLLYPTQNAGLLSSVTVSFKIAGAGFIKLFTKNGDGTYNVIQSIARTFTAGLQTIDLSGLGISVPVGTYFGFSSASGAVDGIVVGTNNSMTYAVDIAGNNNPAGALSSYILQFNYTLSIVTTVNDAIAALQANNGVNQFWVAKTGNDTNLGTISSPFLTIQKAINTCIGKSSAKIIINTGDYREILDFSAVKFESIEILKAQKAVVRILGSDKFSGFAKTSGYTNIYEVAFTGTIPNWLTIANPIFEDKNPSKPILTAEVHPIQKGVVNRLPFTPILAQTAGASTAVTLTTMDTAPGHYYYDTTAHILYLHTSNSSSPITNGFNYEVIQRNANVQPSITNFLVRPNLTMKGIQFMFTMTGFQSSGWATVTRHRCTILGVSRGIADAGGWRDDGSTVFSYWDEAGFCDGDGVNGHVNAVYPTDIGTQDLREGVITCYYFNLWTHDNCDDGLSHHERHEVFIHGILTEYNGDRGVVPAQGCQCTVYDGLARFNGLNPALNPNGGEGFGCVNATIDGKNGTKCVVYNSYSEGNLCGYGVESATNNLLIAYNCVSRNNTQFEYKATNGALLIANNCKATNANPALLKGQLTGGVVTVINDPILT